MKALGLTGGIGMGKSTAAQLLQEWGLAVVDADLLAREVVVPGQPALDEIQDTFGQPAITLDGTLNREHLAKLVFADSEARKRLESILHPRIRERWQNQVQRWRMESRLAAVVIIPLLFEIKSEKEFDATICVACSAETQIERLSSRGWTDAHIEQRIRAQWPSSRKMSLANFVAWSEGEPDVLAAQLKLILESLRISIR
jgi:dephospho-CoA kinase